MDLISNKDGTATTLLFAEKNAVSQPPTATSASGLFSATTPWFGLPTDTVTNKSINPGVGSTGQDGFPSSNHSGGVVVAYCDGHVNFLKDTISSWVYAQLLTSESRWNSSSTSYTSNSSRANTWLKSNNTTPTVYLLDESDVR
jgi:prepilin-type processing-associated H-X9-DG protein